MTKREIPARLQLIAALPSASVPLTVAIALCMLASALLPNLFTLATGSVVAAIPAAVRAGTAGRHLVGAIVSLGVLYVMRTCLAPIQNLVQNALGLRLLEVTGLRRMNALSGRPSIAHLEDPAIQDVVERATGYGGFGPRNAVQGLVVQWTNRLQGAGALVLVARFNLGIALTLFAALVWNAHTLRDIHRQMVQVLHGRTEATRRSTYLRDLATTSAAAKEVRIFGLSSWVVDRFRQAWLESVGRVWQGRRGQSKRMLAGSAPLVVVELGALWLAIHAALARDLSVAALVVTVQAVLGSAGVAIVGYSDSQIEYGAACVPHTRALERATADAYRMEGTRSADAMPAEEIRFEGVAFRYPGRPDNVFTGLNLVIRAGQSLAIVGRNGSGKTTLVKLLARLHDPTGGRILVDGVPLGDLDPRQWQRRIAAIFQEFLHWPLSACDNVGFGAFERLHDTELLRSAASAAGALEMIESLPRGWDTVLSRRFTDGVDLSGGQWQRIALARALFAARAGAGVLVLDEPTANLDVRLEAEFFDRFLDVAGGLTSIVISHRFSSVRRADRIVVLEHGMVIEDGSHDDLVARDGRYAHMFKLQAARYADA